MEINEKIYMLIDILSANLLMETFDKEELVDHLQDLRQLVGQVNLVPVRTPVICNRCKRVDAPMYFLKRSGGKYIPICYDEEGGCWKLEPTTNCGWTDHMGVPCENKAEWRITYNNKTGSFSNACVMHVSVMLADIEEHTITRLD